MAAALGNLKQRIIIWSPARLCRDTEGLARTQARSLSGVSQPRCQFWTRGPRRKEGHTCVRVLAGTPAGGEGFS